MGKDLTRRYGTNPAVRCPLLKSEMHGSEGPGKFQPVFRIPIENEIPGSGPKGKRLPNLLDDPTARGILRDVYGQDASPIVANDEEAVERPNVIVGTVKKSMAAIASRWFRRKASQRWPVRISGRFFFIQREMVLSERSKPTMRSSAWIMGPRRSPGWILNDHTEDEFPNLLRRRSSSNLPPDSGGQPPVHTKSNPAPADG
jgi:hypothetical protein